METPRRRSQDWEKSPEERTDEPQEEQVPEMNAAEEPKQEEKPRGSARPNVDAPGRCVKAIEAIQEHLNGSRKTLFNADNCIVNRQMLMEQLAYLRENLPSSLRTAAKIVDAQQTLEAETKAWRERTVKETEDRTKQMMSEANANAQNLMDQANKEARNLMDRANQEANDLMDRANQEATACVEAARAEAARLIEDAEKKARQMIEEENIVRRARVESDEIREKAQQEASQLQKNTLEFVDQQLMEADRSVSELLNAIRLERNEVRNRRQ